MTHTSNGYESNDSDLWDVEEPVGGILVVETVDLDRLYTLVVVVAVGICVGAVVNVVSALFSARRSARCLR